MLAAIGLAATVLARRVAMRVLENILMFGSCWIDRVVEYVCSEMMSELEVVDDDLSNDLNDV